MSAEERFVIVPHPRDPTKRVKAKVVKFKVLKEDWNEYELENGTLIRVILNVNHISMPIDPETGEFIKNPETGEPIYNLNWNVRIVTLYPKKILEEERNSEKRGP